jgi:hypothetical protein
MARITARTAVSANRSFTGALLFSYVPLTAPTLTILMGRTTSQVLATANKNSIGLTALAKLTAAPFQKPTLIRPRLIPVRVRLPIFGTPTH